MPNTVENEIVELERRYWQALQDGDEVTPARLSDDPCIVAGAQGIASLDRRAVANMMKEASWKLERFEIDPDVKVRIIGERVAVLAYKVREEVAVDGRLLKFEASDTVDLGVARWAVGLRDAHGSARGRPVRARSPPAAGQFVILARSPPRRRARFSLASTRAERRRPRGQSRSRPASASGNASSSRRRRPRSA